MFNLEKKSPRYVLIIKAGIVINIPQQNILIIDEVGSGNLSDLTKKIIINNEGNIVTKSKFI